MRGGEGAPPQRRVQQSSPILDRIDSGRQPADPGGGRAIAHLPGLDGVRGMAILSVMLLHFGVAADFPHHGAGRVGEWVERVFYAGWSGVDLFFVLSGFLISSILLATKSDRQYYRRFYGRRVLRIFPLYYTTLVLGLIVLPQLAAAGVLPLSAQRKLLAHDGQIWLWTYTLNLAMVFGWRVNADLLGHFWTLAIEEQYYLLWPWVVRRLSREVLLRTCVGLMVGALALRIVFVSAGLGWENAYHFTLCRLDAFGVGGLLALLTRDAQWRDRLTKHAPAGLTVTGAALVLMFVSVPRFYPSEWLVVTFGHSVLAIASGGLILLALRTPPPAWLEAAWLRTLGKYSYGIYVWHWPLQRLMLVYAPAPPPSHVVGTGYAVAFLLIGVGGSALAGWVSYRVIEAPFLRLKRLFKYQVGAVKSESG